jgi:multiple sugar transport system substrate-binding protein
MPPVPECTTCTSASPPTEHGSQSAALLGEAGIGALGREKTARSVIAAFTNPSILGGHAMPARCLLTLLSVILALCLLAGCPPPPQGDTPSAPSTNAAGATAQPSGEGGKIRFLAMEYDTNTRGFMKKLEEGFNRENPGYELSIEVVDWNSGKDKLNTLISSGNPPDLVNVGSRWIPEFVAIDAVEPLDSYVTQEFRDKFLPIALQGAQYQGKLYGLPIAVSARALYYNKGVLDAAGVQPPKTWDEIISVSKKINAPDKGQFAFGIQGNKVETDVYFYYFLWANGGEILSEDGKKAAFNSEAGVQALQFMCDLVSKHKVTEPNPTAYDREGLQEQFKSGKLAMMITGPWFWGMLDKQTPNLKYGLAPIPASKKQVTMAVTDDIILMKGSKNKQAAWKFVEYFYQPALRQEWAQTFGMLPELKAVAESDFIKKSPQWSKFMELLPTGKFVPLHPKWTGVEDEVRTGIQEALMGKKSPKQALDEAAQRVDKVISSS